MTTPLFSAANKSTSQDSHKDEISAGEEHGHRCKAVAARSFLECWVCAPTDFPRGYSTLQVYTQSLRNTYHHLAGLDAFQRRQKGDLLEEAVLTDHITGLKLHLSYERESSALLATCLSCRGDICRKGGAFWFTGVVLRRKFLREIPAAGCVSVIRRKKWRTRRHRALSLSL